MTADATEIDSRATPAPSYYRPDVQGLRAVAVLMVVAYHAGGYLPGGFVGVDVFFVISGFVIGQLLHRELQATGTIDFKRFYLRRIRRILPALAVLLSVVLPLSTILAPIGGLLATQRTGFAAALFNANNYLTVGGNDGGYFGARAESNALLHTWSLAVEEQFYFVFPFILWAAWTAFKSRGISAAGVKITLTVVAFISFVLSWALVAGVADPLGKGELIAFYSAPTRAWQFAVGALLAMGMGTWLGKTQPARLASAIGGLALVAFAGVSYDVETAFPGLAALAPTIGTALLIAAATSTGTNPISKLLATKPMQAIGDISYSWYLWHWPIIVFAVAYNQTAEWVPALAAAVSILPAIASYRYIENPLRHSGSFTTPRTLALGAACIGFPLAAFVVPFIATPIVEESDAATPFELHIDRVSGCASPIPLGQLDVDCIWEVDNPVGTAVLLGDSNAGHFSEGFIAAANHLKMNAIVRTSNGCPMVKLEIEQRDEEQEDCLNFVDGSLKALVELKPDIVVLATSSDRYTGGESDWFTMTDGNIAETLDQRLAVWRAALEVTLDELSLADLDVIIVHPVPRLISDGRSPDASWVAAGRGYLGSQPEARELVRSDRASAVEIEKEVTSAYGARTVDFFDLICTQPTCEVTRDSSPVYRDETHISVAESERLTSQWLLILAG